MGISFTNMPFKANTSVKVSRLDISTTTNQILLHFDNNSNNSGTLADGIETGAITYDPISKFGSHSAYIGFNSPSQRYVTIPDITFGYDDFCVDFWYSANSLQVGVLEQQTSFFQLVEHNDGPRTLAMIFLGPAASIPNTFIATASGMPPTAGSLALDGFHHYALTRENNVFRMFVDGIMINSNTQTIDLKSGQLDVGRYFANGGGGQNDRSVDGYFDEFRVIVGEAVYTTNFTPPTQPYS